MLNGGVSTLPSNGHLRYKQSSPPRSKCTCCPYGFHIDQDFVNYAADPDPAQRSETFREKQINKIKRKMRKSVEGILRNGRTERQPENLYDVDRPKVDQTQNKSRLEQSRLFSDSLENIVSDFEDTFSSAKVSSRGRDYDIYSSDVDSSASHRPPRVNGYISDNERIYGTGNLSRRGEIGYVSDGGYMVPRGLRLASNPSSARELLAPPRPAPSLPIPPPPPVRESDLVNDSISSTGSTISSNILGGRSDSSGKQTSPQSSTGLGSDQPMTSSPIERQERQRVMSPVAHFGRDIQNIAMSLAGSRSDQLHLDQRLSGLKEERQYLETELQTAKKRLQETVPSYARPYASMRLNKERSRSVTGGDLTSAYPEDPLDSPSAQSVFQRTGSLRKFDSHTGIPQNGSPRYDLADRSMNLDYFPSARRYTDAGSGSRVRPDDEYMSDTELALGDRFLDRRRAAGSSQTSLSSDSARRYANPTFSRAGLEPDWMRNYEYINGPEPPKPKKTVPAPIPDLPKLPPAIPDLPKYVPVPIYQSSPTSTERSSPHPEPPKISPPAQRMTCDRAADAQPLPGTLPCQECQQLRLELARMKAARPLLRSVGHNTDKQSKEPCQRCDDLRNRSLENIGTNTESVVLSTRATNVTLPVPCEDCEASRSRRLLSIAVNTCGSYRPEVSTRDIATATTTDTASIHAATSTETKVFRSSESSTSDFSLPGVSVSTDPVRMLTVGTQPEPKSMRSLGVSVELLATPPPPQFVDQGFVERVERANKCVGNDSVRVNTFDKGSVTEYCGKKVKISSIHVVRPHTDSPDSGIDTTSTATDTEDLVCRQAVETNTEHAQKSVLSTGVNTAHVSVKDAYLNTEVRESVSRATEAGVKVHDAQVSAKWTGVPASVGTVEEAPVTRIEISTPEPCARCEAASFKEYTHTGSDSLDAERCDSGIQTERSTELPTSTDHDDQDDAASTSSSRTDKTREITREEDDLEMELAEVESCDSPYVPRKVNFTKPRGTRATELSRATAMKKLLTESNSQPVGRFQRGNYMSKSMRVESKKGDPLAYITDRQGPAKASDRKSLPIPAARAMQKGRSGTALPKPGLKDKVSIKGQSRADSNLSMSKEQNSELASSILRDKPAMKVSRPISIELPEGEKERGPSEEELAEATDKLTPLPSEMASSWGDNSWDGMGYVNVVALEYEKDNMPTARDGRLVSDTPEDMPTTSSGSALDESSSSDDEESPDEGSYNADGEISLKCETSPPKQAAGFRMSKNIQDACETLNAHWLVTESSSRPPQHKVDWARQFLQHEWLKTAARKSTVADAVETFLDSLENYSRQLMYEVVNMADQNGNTALHYAVSHGNFDVVSILLDSKVCNINTSNKAGYTPVMLAALCPTQSETDRVIFQRLFQMGDVNVKASQHGQTALMLAVSHGRLDTTKLLLDAGACPNIQDEDGSTALMCAAEHGHKDIVRLLLANSDIQANLTDCDGSTALSIAVDNGHRDIGVLIYAHQNFAKSPNLPRKLTTPATRRQALS